MRILLLLAVFTISQYSFAQRADVASISFEKADQRAIYFEGEDLRSLPTLVHNLTINLSTDVERFRAIYYWVTHNIRGNYELASKNDHMRAKLADQPKELQQWNNRFKKEVFHTLLVKKETLCSGYAYLIQTLARHANIECVIINGRDTSSNLKPAGSDSNHSWNAVKLQGKWYLSDATWSSGYTDMSSLEFQFDYDDTYFLMKPKVFYQTHKPLDKKWSLLTENDRQITD